MFDNTLCSIRKRLFKKWFIPYVAEVIQLDYKVYGNKNSKSYNNILDICLNNIQLTSEEQEEIFDEIDYLLTRKYDLMIANASKDEKLYIVDLKKESEI